MNTEIKPAVALRTGPREDPVIAGRAERALASGERGIGPSQASARMVIWRAGRGEVRNGAQSPVPFLGEQ